MAVDTNMYAETKTWNPFKGCEFDCSYCVPSFQAQAKRQRKNCGQCYNYVPHEHPERLGKIPSAPIVFVCGNGDISFCPIDYARKIVASIRQHDRPDKTFYLQSKRPAYFEPLLSELPDNVVLVTTLETNRNKGYEAISKAPRPFDRYQQFKRLDYSRKVVTVEPVLDFDVRVFASWMKVIEPEYVWLGYNSRPRSVDLPEPTREKLQAFVQAMREANIDVRFKTIPW